MPGENEQAGTVIEQQVPTGTPVGTLANGQKTGMVEDPPGAVDETEQFVIDAFSQMEDLHVDEESAPKQPTQSAPAATQVQAPTTPVVETVQVPVQAQPAAPVPPVQQPVVAPQEPAVQPAPTPTQPQAAVSQAAVTEQQSAQLPVDAFATMASELQKNEKIFIDKLADTHYGISEEDYGRLMGGDPKALSQAMAKVHVNAVSSVLNVVAQQMPNMVFGLLQAKAVNADREKSFWESNKHLNPQQHREAVLQNARIYRAQNPNADAATVNRMVGALTALQLGIAVPQPGMQSAPQVPVQQQVRTPGPVVRQAPVPSYNPVAAGQGGAPQVVDNEWDRMAKIMTADDQGAFDF